MPAVAATGSTLHNVTDNQKRWLVFGIALNKVLVSQIRSFVEQEVQKEYGNLQTRCSIHTQSTSGRLRIWPTFLKYENINGNDVFPRLPGGRFDYSKFDCRVTSHVDFAKLYVENHMAKFNAFDEHCDASAVLSLLGKVPVFSMAVQSAAGDVRQARNAWAHCAFSDWDLLSFQQRFAEMEKLVKSLGLSSADEIYLVNELQDWENKGAILCMNATIDPDLLKTVQQDVNALKNDIDKMAFEEEVNRENVKKALHESQLALEELRERVAIVEHEQQVIRQEQEVIKQDQSSLCGKVNHTEEQISEIKSEQQDMHQRVAYVGEHLGKQVAIAVREQDIIKQEQEVIKQGQSSLCGKVNTAQDQISELKSEQEDVQRRVTYLEDQEKSNQPQINYEIANCESDIAFFAARHDPATRQWLLKDFDKWFSDPGDSRAYVLLGDPGVGKSVMAEVLAQRSREAGHLGAAYFCRHNDNTRNDPRYLLGTIAYQLCKCNSQYSSIVGGEGGIRNLLGNCNLGIQELFTKLLQEPLNSCTPYQHRMLVVIDALDETEYKSRDDFLDLIMNRFPLLPEWVVFFITSRPEETVQFRLNKYNPCIRICAGSSAHFNFYRQHERDIKLFLENRVDFSHLSYSVEDITKMCNGLFLYAFYISRILNDQVNSGKINQLSDLFPGDIDSFFLQNFKRVFDKVGADLYGKLFGCAIVAPSPLPVSFISFILQGENSDLDEQEVIDAVSQFVVLRTSDETITFLHNLIPAWLTDKKKASRKFFVDRIKACEYFRDIIVEFFSAVMANQRWEKPLSIEADLFDYFLRFGVRFLSEYREKDTSKTVFSCLTSYQYMWKRLQNKGIDIYSLIVDLKLSACCQGLSDAEREILQKICLALESNVHVLQGSPHLLHSCLRNSPRAVQENVVIPPDVVASTWMEWGDVPYPACDIPCDMSCFAVSPDKKLLAGGKGKSISLFDAYSVVKVFGPVEVIEKDEGISHLEFSPDGKFVFFGRLDKWFSVEKRCVAEFPQFSENCIRYKWASFISGGRIVVLQRDSLRETGHSFSCAHDIFFRWAIQELHGMDRMESNESAIWRDVGLRKHLVHEVLADFLEFFERKGIIDDTLRLKSTIASHFAKSLCEKCRAYQFEKNHRETPLSIVRKRVIDLYSEIFEYQVWDAQSGRPVLEQAFSSDVMLSPFIFLCHVATALKRNMALSPLTEKEGLSFFNVALINLDSRTLDSWSDNFHKSSDSFVVKNLPIEFRNHLATKSKLSLDGMWIADSNGNTVSLFKKNNMEQFDFEKPVHIIKDAQQIAFTDDSCVFLYVTKHRSLHAVSLQTGIILSSASGFIPFYCTPEEHAGYFFHAGGEEKVIFAREFPRSFLMYFSIPSNHKPVTVAFTSVDTISTLFSECTVESWKTSGVEGSFVFCGLFIDTDFSTENIYTKRAVFSPDGKLIATHQGSEIFLLHHPRILYSSLVGRCEHIISYLTFSPDSSLFLYCIPSSNDPQPLFHVWDVRKKAMSATFLSPLGPQPVHCCCFSADNTKLILCCAFQISIWEYYERPCRLLANVEPSFGPFNAFDKFSHCTVSSDNELLACCIVDRILLYPLNAAARDQTILQLPRAHLGRIEFCQFLKGSRYLISNGVDGTVFLWDLCEWKAIAYARVAQGRESIASLAVSPKEDEVVCCSSFGRLTRIKLCGLVHEMPTKSPTSNWTNREKIAATNRQQQGEQKQRSSSFESAAFSVDDVEVMDWTALVEHMNFMADENLESDDDIYDSDSDK